MEKAVCFSLVKNEEDIIELFVRSNLRFFDELYIADNLSSDSTREILEALVKEGLPLKILEDNDPAFWQGKKTTAFFRRIAQADPGIGSFFFLDADEFIDLDRSALKGLSKGDAFLIERYRYQYSGSEDITACNAAVNIKSKFVKPESPKAFLSVDYGLLDAVTIGDGNHVIRNGKAVISNKKLGSGLIRHYPIRSVNQFLKKNVLGWLGIMLTDPNALNGDTKIGGHWKRAYDFAKKQSFDISPDLLCRHIGYYKQLEGEELVLDETEFFSGVEVKYSNLMKKSSIISEVLSSYEKLCFKYFENDANIK